MIIKRDKVATERPDDRADRTMITFEGVHEINALVDATLRSGPISGVEVDIPLVPYSVETALERIIDALPTKHNRKRKAILGLGNMAYQSLLNHEHGTAGEPRLALFSDESQLAIDALRRFAVSDVDQAPVPRMIHAKAIELVSVINEAMLVPAADSTTTF